MIQDPFLLVDRKTRRMWRRHVYYCF